jgi:hypothetical protein
MDRAPPLQLQMVRLSRPCSSEMVHFNEQGRGTNLYLVMSTEKGQDHCISLKSLSGCETIMTHANVL